MKVLKFGGTSVGSVEGLTSVKNIAESAQEAEIIVVSAFSGVTESLLRGASAASEGDIAFRSFYDEICRRHEEMMSSLFGESSRRERVSGQVHLLLDELKSLYEGVYALRVIPKKTGDQIASMGERLSSLIIAELIEGAVRHDSLNFIKTIEVSGRTLLNSSLTEKMVRNEFADANGISIVPGFIATDSVTGDITTLGRGGSDYTASIIAAALDAGSLEIWTDVDGFMTADPRIVKDSCIIDEISFAEAMELCHFGAKVIYAPALYPVLPKEIPMYIKNTFNPSVSGTVVRRTTRKSKTVTGLASIGNMCLLTLSAPSMVGIVGVDSRLFGALKSRNISVFLVTQSSSETGISVGITADAIEKARVAVDEEFASEISSGVMNPSIVEKDLSTVAVVGPELKMSKGVAAKLFTALSECGIGILACAQGSSEHNISMVIGKENLHKALNVIHKSFFHSEYRELNLFVCGIGTVGGRLLEQISGQREVLMKEKSLKLNVVGISNSTLKLLDSDGIDLSTYRERMTQEGVSVDTAGLRDGIIGMSLPNGIFV
ncbi:MAG: aspartate kinase, partial [Alistipes sp.]|nr:aspartate kinase [Candidatus Minthomonas equi]